MGKGCEIQPKCRYCDIQKTMHVPTNVGIIPEIRNFFVSFSGKPEGFFMVKEAKKHPTIFIGILVAVVFVGNIAFGFFLQSKKTEKATSQITPTITQTSSESLSYQGQAGKDALALLQEKASIEEQGGMVVSINGKKAEASKREYWAFYVNGKLAPLGPADYKTKETDKIEWKIETY